MEQITFIAEPLLGFEFNQYRLVVPIAEELATRYDVSIAAPAFSAEVAEGIESRGIHPRAGTAWFPPPRHGRDEVPSFVLSWARDALLGMNRRLMDRALNGAAGLRLNFTMTTACRSDLWYLQSRPIATSLESIAPSLTRTLRWTAESLGAPIQLVDERHFVAMATLSEERYASCQSLGRWYETRGLPIRGVVPVPVYPVTFAPSTHHPNRDYILVYLGKETETATVRELLRLGVPVKLFGGKSPGWVAGALKGVDADHVENHGYVTHEELRELYTHALFTAFPFTDESFGLVPIESMMCGTPVLSYGRQGPGETIVSGRTGWLVDTAEQFVQTAATLFRQGYPSEMRSTCLEHAQSYQLESVTRTWMEIVRARLDERPPIPKPRRSSLRHAPFPVEAWGRSTALPPSASAHNLLR